MPPTPDGWIQFLDAHRAEGIPELPERLNRRTATALVALHSKATLTDARRLALGDVEATHDGTLRLHPPDGLVARPSRRCRPAVASELGEVAISERAFLDSLLFKGKLRGVLLVENLGAWRDLPVPHGWLFAHVPGWNTSTVPRLLELVAPGRVVHFGDSPTACGSTRAWASDERICAAARSTAMA